MFVQMISDFACPWCRIGKHNLRAAAAAFTDETGEPVSIEYLPFLLDPIAPEDVGQGYRARLGEQKGMSDDAVSEMFAQVERAGAAAGLTFHFDRIPHAQDTMPAHELLSLAPEASAEAVVDALMTAYFEQGKDIGDVDTLIEISQQVGIAQGELNRMELGLRRHDNASEIRAMIQQLQMSGVHGVPFFIIDGAVAVSGAQTSSTFLNALRQAWQARVESGSALST